MKAIVKAHALSLLARQHLLLKDGFEEKYPGAWLWWESAPGHLAKAEKQAADTWVPGMPKAVMGDTLCFQLTGERFRIGSSNEVEVVVADASVAAEACVLSKDSSGWKVAAGASVPEAIVDGNPVAAGIEVPLESGQVISVGQVKLMFLDAAAFAAGVAEAAKKLE